MKKHKGTRYQYITSGIFGNLDQVPKNREKAWNKLAKQTTVTHSEAFTGNPKPLNCFEVFTCKGNLFCISLSLQ